MIVLRNIEMVRVLGTRWEIIHSPKESLAIVADPDTGKRTAACNNVLRREVIEGITITTPGGDAVVVGASKEVGDILGFSQEILNAKDNDIETATKAATQLADALEYFRTASVWDRIQWVFLGCRARAFPPAMALYKTMRK